jgi:hypothetical protein
MEIRDIPQRSVLSMNLNLNIRALEFEQFYKNY